MPDKTDLSDSQSIENASDNLIILHRPEYHGITTIYDPDLETKVDSRGKLLMRVLKGRDYGIGDIIMNCDIKFYRFWAKEDEWNFPYWERYSSEEFWLEHFNLKPQENENQRHLWKSAV